MQMFCQPVEEREGEEKGSIFDICIIRKHENMRMG